MNTETRVGLFALLGIAVFALGILVLGDVQLRDRYRVYIYFDDAGGLPDKGPVKVAGVDVGRIQKISLVNGRAKVAVRIDQAIKIHADAKAYVASTGLIGSKYLELGLGTETAPLLEEGGSIEGETSMSFDELMKKLSDLFKEDPVHGSVATNFQATMSNLRRITDSLSAALADQEKELVNTVQNVHQLSAHARNISANLDEIIGDHKQDLRTAIEKIRSISERLDGILAKVQAGEGTMGKLLTDEQMGSDLKQTFTDVKEAAKEAQAILGRIALIDVYWDYRQRYDFEDEQYRADLGLRIVPRKGKFYFLQGNNIGVREDRDVPGTDLEKRNTITAVMGKDFGPFTLYGGAIRTTGGAGVRFRPLFMSEAWNRRFELEGEAYDFPRNEVVQGLVLDNPVYSAGARILLQDPWLWVGAQVEDIAERKNVNANVNVTFKDEDIAYLLGLVGLAKP